MDKQQINEILEKYVDELDRILKGFSKTSDGIHIQSEDNYRMRQISTELYDLISDHIPNSERYARMVVAYYSNGINNWIGSSSYSSVKEIRDLIQSLKNRIERNPKLFENDKGQIALSDDI